MKRKILSIALTFLSLTTYAQTAREAMNRMIADYAQPLFVCGMVLGMIAAVWHQWENIIDKDNRGTRKDGIIALAWYIGFIILVGIIIAQVQRELSSVNIRI